MNRSSEIEIKVGIFVSLGLGLVMLGIILVGGGTSVFERKTVYHTKFSQIEGLIEGATVKIAGVKVGQVTEINFLKDSNQVDVEFAVARRYQSAIRTDSTVSVQTQGMLGDRYIIVHAGNPESPLIRPGGEIKSEAPKELKDYLTDADEVIDKLKGSLQNLEAVLGSFRHENRAENFFKNLSSFSARANDSTKTLNESMNHLNSVMSKIDRGDGTIGALVNDPALYDDIRALLGGANRNRVLKYFIKKSVEESREAAKDKK